MKIKIILVFLFSFLIPLHFSFAVYTPSIGSQSNPIYIQVQQDPVPAWKNAWDKINSRPYVSTCSYIDKIIDSRSALTVDMSDRSSIEDQTRDLNYLYSSYQSCVSRVAQTQSQTCPNGTGLRNGSCIPRDKICEIDLGTGFEWDGTYNSNGGANCSCKDGYTTQIGKCVVVQQVQTNDSTLSFGCTSTSGFNAIDGTPCGNTKPTKTKDQICADDYGVNSIWANTFNEKGGLVCDCKIGYQFNQEQTQCISIPKVEAKTTTSIVKKVAEVKTVKNEGKENSSIIVKPDTASLDQKPTPVSEEVKPKSFWTRLKGWLGF